MRESRSYGSVRGVAGNRYPYRDPSSSSRGVYPFRKPAGWKLGSLCAGINRHDVKNERVCQERSSDPS
jgi:hypothetical protein